MRKVKVRRRVRRLTVSKKCFFCEAQKMPWFSDVEALSRFTTERGKIIPSSRSGLCAKHQRRLTTSIKHARHLALMPFVARV